MINFNNINAIDIFPVNSSSFCMRVPNAKFKSISVTMRDQTSYCNVYPEEYKEENNNTNINLLNFINCFSGQKEKFNKKKHKKYKFSEIERNYPKKKERKENSQ